MVVPRAQLKVFAPLDAFPPAERERWAAYVRAGRGLTRAEVAAAESGDTAARLLTGRAPLGPDAALVRRAGQRVLICPLDLDLRAAVALAEFRRRVPPAVVDAFVPDPRARGHLQGLAERSQGARVPHVLDEPWAVPLHWFLAFAPDERRVTDPPEGAGPRLRYLTTVGQALVRLARAITVVEATLEDGEEILVELAAVAAWLDSFVPEAVLELDYGRVAGLFTAPELRADRTCEELWEAVDALEAGDLMGAAAGYGVARARWSGRRAKQRAS
jgi:hypothetical protein